MRGLGDKAVVVLVDSDLYGSALCVLRDISSGGLVVEIPYVPPIGTVLTVFLQHNYEDGTHDDLVWRAEVVGHAGPCRAARLRFVKCLEGVGALPARVH